jgi:hypothetical protein
MQAPREDNAGVLRLSVLVALLAGGCHGGADGASCGQVGTAFQAIAGAEVAAAKIDDATRRAVADQIPAMRDALVAVCKDGAWAAQVRDCMAKAPDHAALQSCEAGLTDDQRRAIDKATRGESDDGR